MQTLLLREPELGIKARTKYDEPIFRQGYRITFVRNEEDVIIGALVEGPRIPRPLYIPREPGAKHRVRLPEHVKKLLRKNGFNI
jgi:hypothetical protein